MAPPTPPTPPARDRDCEPIPKRPQARSMARTPGKRSPRSAGERGALVPAGIGESRQVVAPHRLPQSETPFAWQDGQRLLLLDEEADGWTFAELRFDAARCHYVEVRRATFRWPREAAGAILARGLAFGPDGIECLAVALDGWLAIHLAVAVPENRAGS